MSVSDRRNSLRKSSIGIESIRKSVTSLSEGLTAIGIKSRELLKQTRERNKFKSKLISQDAEFFKKRREIKTIKATIRINFTLLSRDFVPRRFKQENGKSQY